MMRAGKQERDPVRNGRRAALLALLLALALPNCEFDASGTPGFFAGHRVVIRDPAPTGADCEQRSRQMMMLVHRLDAETAPNFPGLPSEVNSVDTPNGNDCEYATSILVFHPEHISTLPWFVLAMDEGGWVAECETPLLVSTTGGVSPVGEITFVRGQSDCEVAD
jgi:hypothetical protein